MGIHEALRSTLTTDVSVGAIVAERVYSNTMPKNRGDIATEFPCIVMHQVSHTPTHSHAGPSGYAEYRMQINLWAKSFDDVEALSHAVRQLLDGFKGIMPPIGDAVLTVESSFMDSEEFDVDDEDDALELHLARQDYLIAVLE